MKKIGNQLAVTISRIISHQHGFPIENHNNVTIPYHRVHYIFKISHLFLQRIYHSILSFLLTKNIRVLCSRRLAKQATSLVSKVCRFAKLQSNTTPFLASPQTWNQEVNKPEVFVPSYPFRKKYPFLFVAYPTSLFN